MSTGDMFTDEELTAFLDGVAEADLHARLEAALETDAALAARLAALDIPMAQLRAGFDLLAAQAPAAPALPVAVVKPRRGLWAAAAAVLLAFGIGGIGGYQYRGAPPEPGWMAVAANYQVLYTRDTLDIPSPDAAVRAAMLQEVSQRDWPRLIRGAECCGAYVQTGAGAGLQRAAIDPDRLCRMKTERPLRSV